MRGAMKKKWLAAFIVCVLAVLVGAYYGLDPETKTLDNTERERLGGNYIALADGTTHYALTGPATGNVVVLVHGGTVPMWNWDRQVRALSSAGYRVLSYDHFGRGYSDRPDVTYDRALYTRQLIELVNKLALPEKFDLVGVSFGGAIAVSFAAQHPRRVRSLTLISPVIKDFKVPGVFRIPVVGEFAARMVGTDMIVERFAALVNGNPDSERYKKLFIEQTTYGGFQRSLLSLLRSDALRDYSNEYQVAGRQDRKTLLIWGREDVEITRGMIDDVRSFIPNHQFKPVEGGGHGVALQKPDVVNSLILEFLQEG